MRSTPRLLFGSLTIATPQIKLLEEQKRILWHLRRHGPTSRSALAMHLGMSNSALTKLSRELLSLGLVDEARVDEAQARGTGRPVVPLRISATGGYAAGATVYHGALTVALVDYTGATICVEREPFDSPDPRKFAKAVLRILHDLAAREGLLMRRLLGLGVGVPGLPLNKDGTRRWTVPSLAGWLDVPLDEVIGDYVGMPVWIENDANAAALGEYYAGALFQEYSTVVVILLGYGIGAGIISDGRLLSGEAGDAGDIGRLYPGDLPRPSPLDLLAVLAKAGCALDSLVDLEERTRDYAPVVNEWVDRAAGQLELVVDGGMAWLNPGAIVLSSPLPHTLLDRLIARLGRSRLMTERIPIAPPALLPSRLGGASVVIGSALLPIHAVTLPSRGFFSENN